MVLFVAKCWNTLLFCRETLKYGSFCRETLKYGTFCRKSRTYALRENSSEWSHVARKPHNLCYPESEGKWWETGRWRLRWEADFMMGWEAEIILYQNAFSHHFEISFKIILSRNTVVFKCRKQWWLKMKLQFLPISEHVEILLLVWRGNLIQNILFDFFTVWSSMRNPKRERLGFWG